MPVVAEKAQLRPEHQLCHAPACHIENHDGHEEPKDDRHALIAVCGQLVGGESFYDMKDFALKREAWIGAWRSQHSLGYSAGCFLSPQCERFLSNCILFFIEVEPLAPLHPLSAT